MSAPLPPNESERLCALQRYEILDTESEEQIDDITLLASRICGTPLAMISLIDEDRQWFKSVVGSDVRETPRDLAFCGHTILQRDVLVVEDAAEDPRFVDHPLVTGSAHVRFYAGAPLLAPDGHALGSLCVIDLEPRTLSEEQKQSLRALSRQVVSLFELRRSLAESRQTVAQLQKAEESLRLLGSAVEQATDSILITDAKLAAPGPSITFVNPAFTRMTGYSAEDCVGRSPRILQGTRTDRTVTQELREHMEQGLAYCGEAINYRKDGSEFCMEWQIAPILNPSGKVTHFVAVQRDISKRKIVETELHESKHFLQSSLDALTALIAILDENGEIVFINRAWEEFAAEDPSRQACGVGGNYLQGCDAAMGRGSEDTCRVAAGIRAVISGEEIEFTLEYLSHRGEEQCWYIVRITRFPGPGPVRVVVAHVNITTRKEAEAALQSSMEEFRTLAEAMPQIVWVARPDGWHTHFNQRWMDYTGLTLAESLGHGWLAPFHPEDQPLAARLWAAANAGGEPYELEYRLRGVDGTYRWMLGRALPLRAPTGEIIKWFGTDTDIHARKVAERETQRASEEIERLNADLEVRVTRRTEALFAATLEAERANRAKSEFLSRMSHELRTPMNAILGFAQVLETEDTLSADQRDSVDQILKGGNHLLGLINEVLDITSIDAGKMTISTEPVALQELVEESVSLLRPMAAQLSIQLASLPAELAGLHALADRQRLKQVLLNLLGNALKYNRPGGRVTIDCAALLTGPDEEPAIRLAVTDTGWGLSADQLARLFQPFERLGAENARVEGTGLGLVLAKRMVEHMGGTMGVESAVGHGTTFWVKLRRAETLALSEEPAGSPAEFPTTELACERRVLLYIEDNPANVRLITRILNRRPSIQLLCAETGALGLRAAREQGPDLILLDLHLPDSDGDHILTALRSDPHTMDIPVIMLTADAQPARREQLLAAGASSFITKPIEVRMLLAAIDQFMELRPVAIGSPAE